MIEEIQKFSVYLLTNLVNGKYYVGQTSCDPYKVRWAGHKNKAKSGINRPLYNAMRKHGPENFSMQILAATNSLDEVLDLEKIWISLLSSQNPAFGYNLTPGGEGCLGHEPTQEQRLAQSEKVRNWYLAHPEEKDRHSEFMKEWHKNNQHPFLGIKRPPEFCEKMRTANLGRKQSEGQKKAASEKMQEIVKDPDYITKLRKAGKELWNDSEYVERVMSARESAKDKLAASVSEKWKDEDFSSRVKEGLRKHWSNPEVLAKRSEQSRRLWSDPEQRAKIIAAQNAGRSRKKAEKLAKAAT